MIIRAGNQLTPTPDALRSAEADLIDRTKNITLVWCGRAATALYWAYRLVKERDAKTECGEVILPAMSCATPANAALLAGLTPRFADVEPATGLVTLASVQARWTPRTRAVVFIHLFGQTTDLQPLAAWCRSRNIILIEDVAQALGAHLPDGSWAGSVGDAAVFSFNETKILDCGGGALALRSEDLAQAFKVVLESELPAEQPDADTAQLLGQSYRNLHHGLVALLRLRATSEASTAFLRVRPAFERLFLRPLLSDPCALARAWENLPAIIDRRYKKANVYAEQLRNGPWRLLNGWRESGVCWRFSLLLDDGDDLVPVCEAVRRDGFHVSNLYWPVDQFFRPEDDCLEADAFGRHIVNLWVDDSVDIEWVKRCASSLQKRSRQDSSSKRRKEARQG